MQIEEKNISIAGCDIGLKLVKNVNASTTILWLGGYLSDMSGTKASFLRDLAIEKKLNCVCFDFSHTGLSQPKQDYPLLKPQAEPAFLVKENFLEATLSNWLEEAFYIYKEFCNENTIIIGSSCGGWVALLLARLLAMHNIKAHSLILLAPAPDFTKNLLDLTPRQLEILEQDKYIYVKEEGEDIALAFSKNFLEDAKKHYVLDKILPITIPVYILQGELDKIVPKAYSAQILNILPLASVSFTILPQATHNLSRPQDLAKLAQLIDL